MNAAEKAALTLPLDELEQRIRDERRTRQATIGELTGEFGANWPETTARMTVEADEAVDALLVRGRYMPQLRTRVETIRSAASTYSESEEPKVRELARLVLDEAESALLELEADAS